MGSATARDLKECNEEGLITLEEMLTIHFRSNCYPPLPLSLLPVAVKVIELAEAGQWNEHVELPEGITWRGQDTAPVCACIDGWRLESFLDGEED